MKHGLQTRPGRAARRSRPPRLSAISGHIETCSVSGSIWAEFSKNFQHSQNTDRVETVRSICATAHDHLEMEMVVRAASQDAASRRQRMKRIQQATESLLIELLAEKVEFLSAQDLADDIPVSADRMEGVDGLNTGERIKVVEDMTDHTSSQKLHFAITPDLRDLLTRRPGTSKGHPVFGVADPVDIGALVRGLALMYRRVKAEVSSSATTEVVSKKAPNRIFLESIGDYIDELCAVFSHDDRPRYSDDGAGSVSGWLPDLLRAAEKHAIEHRLEGITDPMLDTVFRNLCNQISGRAPR